MEPSRNPIYQRNDDLESLLNELNELLAKGETERLRRFGVPQKPVVFVIGSPRSGTTLMMQWLASTGQFAYPTNLTSRFYAAPYTGSLIYALLTDPRFQYRDEFKELMSEPATFQSSLGKTAGVCQPNEFWYYWRRFFPIDVPQPISEDARKVMDPKGFARGIAAIEHVFDKPFATKGMLLQYNLDILSRAFDNVIYIYMRRSLNHNAYSLLRARERYYGDRSQWYSARPPQYERLSRMDPVSQVVGQVVHTNHEIEQQLAKLPENQFIHVNYESFCDAPAEVFDGLCNRFESMGSRINSTYEGPIQFDDSNRSLPNALVDEIQNAYEEVTMIDDSTNQDN